MPAIIQSHTTGAGRSGIVGGYVRPPVITKQGGGARIALDTLFQSIFDGPWFTRYVGCGLIYLLLIVLTTFGHSLSHGCGAFIAIPPKHAGGDTLSSASAALRTDLATIGSHHRLATVDA